MDFTTNRVMGVGHVRADEQFLEPHLFFAAPY
jgi:hypothetical protein